MLAIQLLQAPDARRIAAIDPMIACAPSEAVLFGRLAD